MGKLFYPQSLVIFGLSDSPGNLGKNVVENLNGFGFAGGVFGLGRSEKEVCGRKVYKEIDDIPEKPDLAVLIIPAPAVPEALELCRSKGIRHVIIEAAGFSELNEEKKALEKEIMEIACEAGITLLGPNCVGVVNTENGLCTPFIPLVQGEVRHGGHSFITQSGGLMRDLLRRCGAENIGLNKAASIGNKLMVDENDVLEYLINDAGTKTIGLYLEDIRDGRRLMRLASSTEKPIIMLKGNASPSSREIASFHTAALVGDTAVANAAFRQAGIHHVGSMQDVADSFKIFDLPPMRGPNVVIVVRSGGQGVLLADEAYRYGFSLPKLPPSFFERVNEQTKAGVMRNTNPVDLGDVWGLDFYLEVVEMALQMPEVDGVVFYFEYGNNHEVSFDILKGVERLTGLYGKPVALCTIPDKSIWFDLRYSRSFPYFSESERTFSALRRSLDHFIRTSGMTKKASGMQVVDSGGTTTGKRSILPVADSFSLMEQYGVPVADYVLLKDRADGIEWAKRTGYPVALKKAEPFILHKTEAEAVRLNIRDDFELEQAMDTMSADLYLLQKMAPEGVETIVGGKKDPCFGPVVVFGLGGVFVEVLKDATMRVVPVDAATAEEMIGEIKGAALLKGARGAAPADKEALIRTIINVSRLLAEHPEIVNLDINPLRIFEAGKGCMALDVKIECVEQ